jgi:5-deoxy-glucuronate isomerase
MSGRSLIVRAKELSRGYNPVTGPANSELKLLEFGRICLDVGESCRGATDHREACLNILSGRADVEISGRAFDSVRYPGVGERKDVFSGNPALVYLPRDSEYAIEAVAGPLDIAVFHAISRKDGRPFLVKPSDRRRQTFGKANWTRHAVIGLGDDDAADRLLVGETYNPPGNWSSYPPHKHDAFRPPQEEPYEEIYFFKVNPPQGFGLQRIYGGVDGQDEAFVVKDGDATTIPGGYHPVVAGAGYELYYLWALAGESRRFGSWSDDPDHAWIRDLEASA